MLINYLTESYRSIIGFVAWLFLIIAFIAGIVFGNFIDKVLSEYGIVHSLFAISILAGFLFTLVALIIEVFVIPPFMILFTIDKRLKNIEDELKKRVVHDKGGNVENAGKSVDENFLL